MKDETYSFVVGQAIPGAPFGVLGGFIERKLGDYVEPERLGTPKGQPVGFSKKKFHSALLALTNVDLRKEAKHIKVSYGVLRKWRTEEAFDECVQRLMNEFINGMFLEAANANMALLTAESAASIEVGASLDFEAVGAKNRLPGFEDAGLYSAGLILEIQERFHLDVQEAVNTGKNVFRCLTWARPLGRLFRGLDSHAERARRGLAMYLSTLQRRVLFRPEIDKDYQIGAADTIAQLIREVLKD